MFLEISQNSQENICTRVSFFNKVAGLRPAPLLKKELWHAFSYEFWKISKNTFFRGHLQTTVSTFLFLLKTSKNLSFLFLGCREPNGLIKNEPIKYLNKLNSFNVKSKLPSYRNHYKKRPRHRRFHVNSAKFSIISFYRTSPDDFHCIIYLFKL